MFSLDQLMRLRLNLSNAHSSFLGILQPLVAQTVPPPNDIIQSAPFKVTAEGAQSVLQNTQRDLEQHQAIDLEDTLSLDSGITVGRSTGVAQKIHVRNLGERPINVSVDGATQSGSLFHHIGRIAVEPELLKEVEIRPGTGAAFGLPGKVVATLATAASLVLVWTGFALSWRRFFPKRKSQPQA